MLVEEGSMLPAEGLFHVDQRTILLLNGTMLPNEGSILARIGLFLPKEGKVDFGYGYEIRN